MNPRFLVLITMILGAAVARLVPHPWNFAPVTAMALFAGAHFSKKGTAFLVPVGALFLSDIFLGFYPEIIFVYASFALVVGIGIYIKNHKNVFSIAGGALLGSLSFFLLTNFVVWLTRSTYPHTFSGLMMSYSAALPFFKNALLGDAFYTALLFGSFALVARTFPILKEQTNPA